MTREQVMEVLEAYRPGVDDTEPLIVEALALAEQDHELRSWLEQQQALDGAIRRKLLTTEPGDHLLSQVRAGIAAREARSWQRWVPLAACLVLLAALAGFLVKHRVSDRATDFAGYRMDMAELLQTFPRLDRETDKLEVMRQWLADKHGLTRAEIPDGLRQYPGIGCRTLDWRGKELALLCFMVDGEVVHLIVMRQSDFPGDSFGETPEIVAAGKFTTASWKQGDTAYLALTRGNAAFLQRLL